MAWDEMKPIDRFYPVRFPSPEELRAWRIRLLEYATKVGGLAAVGAGEARPVVFVPLLPKGHSSVYAYVSEGGRRLVREFSRLAELEAPVSLGELPDGHTLLYGDGGDASAYERRAEDAGDTTDAS